LFIPSTTIQTAGNPYHFSSHRRHCKLRSNIPHRLTLLPSSSFHRRH